MKICPKCKYQDNSKEPTSCPRCGVIYAKIEGAQKTRAAQELLNQQFENTLRREEAAYSEQESLSDTEWQRDQESYTVAQHLTAFFNIFAIGTAISYVIGGIILWRMLGETPFITSSGRYTFTVLYVMSAPFPIAIYLALASALKLGKDIADNTRATRHYMSYLVHKRKTRS